MSEATWNSSQSRRVSSSCINALIAASKNRPWFEPKAVIQPCLKWRNLGLYPLDWQLRSENIFKFTFFWSKALLVFNVMVANEVIEPFLFDQFCHLGKSAQIANQNKFLVPYLGSFPIVSARNKLCLNA